MAKTWLAGAAALALISGAAFAQSSDTMTPNQNRSPDMPAAGSSSAPSTQSTSGQTRQSNADRLKGTSKSQAASRSGASKSKSRTTARNEPDGTYTTYQLNMWQANHSNGWVPPNPSEMAAISPSPGGAATTAPRR